MRVLDGTAGQDTYMDVPRLATRSALDAEAAARRALLDLALFEVVHVDVDAIFS